MMRVRAIVVTAWLALAAAFPAAAAAGGFPDGASIASASLERLEQGDDSTTVAAISADARYVVFDTRATNFYPDGDADPPNATRAGGVFRRDLIGGALVKVADGDVVSDADGSLVRLGAHAPSVSSDGRFVAFSTAQQLVPADTNDNIDVYRRDMNVAPAEPGSFVLVSARDGSDTPATYAPRPIPLPGRNPGSDVFPGRAISADGNRVAFRTVEIASDLPDRATADVPAGQVLVRDITARSTRLLTLRSANGQPAGGATGPVVLSADGSTVAWVGSEAPVQTRFLPGEQIDATTNFYLYRRIDAGVPVTRRITGVADPDDPACDLTPISSNPTATGPCYGALSDTEQGRGDISQRAPALSADGLTVAFLAAAAGRPTNVSNPGLDLFVTDMRPGVTRKAGTRELTVEGAGDDVTQSAPIESVSMSADGFHVLLTTLRSRFVLRTLTPIGPAFRRQPDAREVYAIDLRAGTIERAVRGAGGLDAAGDVGANPALSADGSTIVFTSAAGNLFFGDANEKIDAFWQTRDVEAPTVAPPPAPAGPSFQDDVQTTGPRLGVSTRRRSDGSLTLTVTAPAAGRLIVFARAGKPLRTVARAAGAAKPKQGVRLVLKLRGKDLRRLRSRKRLSTRVRVRFVPKDATAKALTRVVKARFEYTRKRRAKPGLDTNW